MKPELARKVHQIYEVVGFRSVGPYTLDVEFNDGVSRQIDFEGVLEGELYGPLKDLAIFQQVKLDREGGNLVWPGGADFDPEILHDWPERKAAMLAAALRWRKGAYAARKTKSGRASAVYPSPEEAFKKATELGPEMPGDDRLFVEKRKQGDCAAREGEAGRASVVEPAPAEALKKPRAGNSKILPKIERIQKTGGRDKWRKP
jgi:Protein of unknown function (DUF2442)